MLYLLNCSIQIQGLRSPGHNYDIFLSLSVVLSKWSQMFCWHWLLSWTLTSIRGSVRMTDRWLSKPLKIESGYSYNN